MSALELCKFGCGKELSGHTGKSKFVEADGTEHTKERCESLRNKPIIPTGTSSQQQTP